MSNGGPGFNLEDMLSKLGYIPKPQQRKKPEGTFMVKGNMLDDRTHAQLAAEKFSGIRANDMWNRFEFWILGLIEKELPYQAFFLRPELLNETYAECFGITPVFDKRTQRDIDLLKERKATLSEPEVQKALDALSSTPEGKDKV